MSDLGNLPKEERLERMRHSAAHIMAEAVTEMFPEAKLGIGPPIDTGFYYDFDLPRPLSTEDLPVIEEKMRARIASNVPFEPSQISKDEARQRFAGQPYKIELIDGIEDEECRAVPAREFIDSPGTACRADRRGTRVQTDERGRRVLARQREEPDAPAHLRSTLRHERRARCLPSRSRRPSGATTASWGESWTCSRSTRSLGRAGYWHPKGGRIRTEIEDFGARAQARLRPRVHAPHGEEHTLETSAT